MGSVLIRLHSLGDVVLAEPAARYLAGSGRVSFAVREAYAPVVERMGLGVEPMVLPDGTGALRLRRLLREAAPDVVADLQGNLTTMAALWPRRSLRYVPDRRRRGRILRGSGERLAYRAEEFLRLVGGEGSAMPHLRRFEEPEGGRPAAGLVAGGRWRSKSIPADVLAETSRRLVDLLGMDVYVLGAESDRGIAEETARRALRPQVVPVAGEGGVERLIRRIESLDVLVSPDSGPAHLAAALGVPVVVVFTSTHPRLGFWPEDLPTAVSSGELECRPCHRHGGDSCPRGGWECREGLMPGDIVGAVRWTLDQPGEEADPCPPR